MTELDTDVEALALGDGCHAPTWFISTSFVDIMPIAMANGSAMIGGA